MQPSLAARLCLVGAVVAASACDGPTAATSSQTDLDAAKAGGRAGTVHLLKDFALYMPAAPEGPRAVIVALGGPKTSAFATGGSFMAPPVVESRLQALGEAMRAFADERGVAILGGDFFGPTALQDGVASDERILAALAEGAAKSGRPELTTVPIMTYGISGGGAQASGFAARHPGRVAGALLTKPVRVAQMLTDAQRAVPTFLILAETDVFVDNVALGQSFAANRAGGALWAMAIEQGVEHFSLTDALRNTIIEWMGALVTRRVAGASGRLQPSVASSGWLGDPASGEVSPWGRYDGDRAAASWFPTQQVAEDWRTLIGAASGD